MRLPKAHSTICKSCEYQGGVGGVACLRSWWGSGDGWRVKDVYEKYMRLERKLGLSSGVRWWYIAAYCESNWSSGINRGMTLLR